MNSWREFRARFLEQQGWYDGMAEAGALPRKAYAPSATVTRSPEYRRGFDKGFREGKPKGFPPGTTGQAGE